MESKELDKALSRTSAILSTCPESQFHVAMKIELLVNLNDLDEALTFSDTSVKKFPNNP